MRMLDLSVFALVGLCLALGACGGARPGGNAANVPSRVVIDDLQREVAVPNEIKRAVSLAPSVTENVFAVGAGNRLVGVTTFCNYPEEAAKIAKIGDTMTPNMEAIVALKPDVVLVSTASQVEAFTKTLEQNHIAVYVTDPRSVDEVFVSLERLSRLFGTEKSYEVGQLLPELRNRVGNVSDKIKDGPATRVFVQVSREPLFTIGKTAFLNDVIAKAGGVSVTADVETAFPKLSKETASAMDPEVIILSDSEDNQEPNAAFKNSTAVRNGRVYKINADIISRPGPRLVEALEQIAKDLHPEKF